MRPTEGSCDCLLDGFKQAVARAVRHQASWLRCSQLGRDIQPDVEQLRLPATRSGTVRAVVRVVPVAELCRARKDPRGSPCEQRRTATADRWGR